MPARRRGQGEGGLYQRASDGKWVGTIDLGWIDGTRRRKVVYGDTKREAADKKRRTEREQERGRDLSKRPETVATLTERWLRDVVPDLAPKTQDQYRRLSRLHIVPALGRERVDLLTSAKITRWLRQKREGDDAAKVKPLSAKTCNHLRGILRTILNVAVRESLIVKNPVMDTKPVPGESRAPSPLTKPEMTAFLATIAGDPYETLYRLTLSLGLRIGETLGLRWRDVDLAGAEPWAIGRPCLRIEQTIQRVSHADGTTALIVKAPKTKKSRRVLPIPAVLIPLLKAHKRAQTARQLASPIWTDSGLVFTTATGSGIDPRNALRSFSAACDRAGIDRHRLHDLRHSAATALLAQGVSMKVVSELLGHSQIGTTANIYGHVLSESLADATDKLAAAWGN